MTKPIATEELISQLLGRTQDLIRLKKYDDAEYFLKEIERHKPDELKVPFQRGLLYMQKEEYEKALEQFTIYYCKNPNSLVNLNNMATACFKMSKYLDALHYYEEALKLDPRSDYVLDALGATSLRCFHVSEAIDYFKRAMELSYNPIRHSNVMLAMIYADTVTPQNLFEEARSFGARVSPKHENAKEPDRKLDKNKKIRVGYVSPDFKEHPVPYFLAPLLKGHSRENFEVYAYSHTSIDNPVMEKIKIFVDQWRDIRNFSDDAIYNLIRNDNIDILIDVAGHTSFNKLTVFAQRPAPVQATWLGYTATTGVEVMDYRITDFYADPPGLTEHLNTETLWRLPRIFAAYAPHEKSPDVIDHPPFEDNGYVTFGCFNNFIKVRDPVLQTWAKILEAVPDARLILEIENIQEEKLCNEVVSRIKKSGIPLDRIVLEPKKRSNQYVLYNKIDIALDPFPGVGGTTSMDTLWMGVPFITLAGKHFASRMGVSILKNTDLVELVAETTEDYVAIAVGLANDKVRLKKIRHNLRARFSASPAMDSKAFTQDMDTAYREMWTKYCEANS